MMLVGVMVCDGIIFGGQHVCLDVAAASSRAASARALNYSTGVLLCLVVSILL